MPCFFLYKQTCYSLFREKIICSKMNQLFSLFYALFTGLLFYQSDLVKSHSDLPLVQTEWSLIRGFTRTIGPNNRTVNHFLGIPYALPPVGPLRFKRPVPLKGHRPYKGIYEANSYRYGCMQTAEDQIKHSTIPSSENCLFINVYSPSEASPVSLRPVLVFIHGSGFVYGSSGNPHIYGGYLAGLGDMVFVVFNYRLGALGLMYGHPTKIPGDMALWDQKAALEWVHDNIKAFGGDPSRVTMMGHSAGATFSTMHLISHETRHLYQQAMVMSGIACHRSGLDSPSLALKKTREVVRRVGCERLPLDDVYLTDEEIECLMTIDTEILVNNQGNLESKEQVGCMSSIFLPSYGSSFLEHSTDSLLEKSDFRKNIPILVGKVPQETVGVTLKSINSIDSAVETIKSSIQNITGNSDFKEMDAILDFYLDSVKDGDVFNLTGAVNAAVNDLCQHCPILKFAKKWAETNQVYLYYYTYVTESYKNDPARAYGPFHADDVKLLFGLPFEDSDEYSDKDREVSSQLIEMWSHFVHTGSMRWPAISATPVSAKTVPYQYEINGKLDPKYIDIDSDDKICSLLPN